MVVAQKFRDMKRLKQISNILYKNEMGHILEKLGLKQYLTFHKKLQAEKFMEKHESAPKRLRKAMEEASGAFPLFCKFLGFNIDSIPEDYRKEFSKASEISPPIHYLFIKKRIEKELKKPLGKVFSRFQKTPFVSSPLTQTHKAVLKSGEEVAVKIRKPNVSIIVKKDLELLDYLAHLIQQKYRGVDFSLHELVEEFSSQTRRNLDFRIEARNMERIRNEVGKDEGVIIPKIYEEYSSSKILTYDLIGGKPLEKISNLRGLKANRSELSRKIMDFFLSQTIYNNIFKLNPGKETLIMLDAKNFSFSDFDSMINIDQKLSKKLESIVMALAISDKNLLLNSIVEVSDSSNNPHLEEFKEELSFYLGEHYDENLNVNLSLFSKNLFTTAKRYDIGFPKELTYFLNSMILIEDSLRKISSKFNMTDGLKNKAEEIIKLREDSSHSMSLIRKNINELKDSIKRLPKEINKTKKTGKKTKDSSILAVFENSGKTLTLGLVTIALIVSGTVILLAGLPPLILNISALGSLFMIAAIIVLIILLFSE